MLDRISWNTVVYGAYHTNSVVNSVAGVNYVPSIRCRASLYRQHADYNEFNSYCEL